MNATKDHLKELRRSAGVWVLTISTIAVGATVLIETPAGAHTGLPTGGAFDGVVHPLLGIDHLLAMIAVGVVAANANRRWVAWSTPVGFVAGMLLGGLAGIAGLAVPGGEIAIAASVVALGLIIVLARDEAGLWVPTLALVFGALHGHAHGAELPADAVPIAYVTGFLVATASLHLAGTAIGLGIRRSPAARFAAGTVVSAAGVVLVALG